MFIKSIHKELVGRVNGQPYHVVFDADGQAEVEEAVGEQLLQLSIAELVQQEPTKPTEPTELKGLQDMSVPELKAHAKENGIVLGQARTKEDIITKIEAQNEVEEGEEEEEGEAE